MGRRGELIVPEVAVDLRASDGSRSGSRKYSITAQALYCCQSGELEGDAVMRTVLDRLGAAVVQIEPSRDLWVERFCGWSRSSCGRSRRRGRRNRSSLTRDRSRRYLPYRGSSCNGPLGRRTCEDNPNNGRKLREP